MLQKEIEEMDSCVPEREAEGIKGFVFEWEAEKWMVLCFKLME